MNGKMAKRLRRIALALATEPSTLREAKHDRSMRYPNKSARAIYQKLKRAVARKEIIP